MKRSNGFKNPLRKWCITGEFHGDVTWNPGTVRVGGNKAEVGDHGFGSMADSEQPATMIADFGIKGFRSGSCMAS